MIAMQLDQLLQLVEAFLTFSLWYRFDIRALLLDEIFVLQNELGILLGEIAVTSCERKIVKKPNAIRIPS